jgi:hypothetical protein
MGIGMFVSNVLTQHTLCYRTPCITITFQWQGKNSMLNEDRIENFTYLIQSFNTHTNIAKSFHEMHQILTVVISEGLFYGEMLFSTL